MCAAVVVIIIAVPKKFTTRSQAFLLHKIRHQGAGETWEPCSTCCHSSAAWGEYLLSSVWHSFHRPVRSSVWRASFQATSFVAREVHPRQLIPLQCVFCHLVDQESPVLTAGVLLVALASNSWLSECQPVFQTQVTVKTSGPSYSLNVETLSTSFDIGSQLGHCVPSSNICQDIGSPPGYKVPGHWIPVLLNL